MTGGRIERLQTLMGERGVDYAMFSVGPDLPYLTGYRATPSERLTMLVVPVRGEPVIFVPLLEAPRLAEVAIEVVAWGEQEDPVRLVARRCQGARSIAVGDHTWSVFLVRLLSDLPEVRWGPGSQLTRALRVVKDEREVEALRRAAGGVDRVLQRIPLEVRFRGRSEADLAADLRRMVVEEGHDTAEFAIVASGANGASPHHEPGARVIAEGDLVVCDFGGTVDGYYSDVTRTFTVGPADGEGADVHALVAEANLVGREAVEPGVPCQEVDAAVRRVIADAGYSEFFVHRTGHGIGLEVHEHPYIVAGNAEALTPGMAFSIEPGIYLPGRLGVRIEDIVVCAPEGADVLNRERRDLVEVG